jgi:hypothetical protein
MQACDGWRAAHLELVPSERSMAELGDDRFNGGKEGAPLLCS